MINLETIQNHVNKMRVGEPYSLKVLRIGLEKDLLSKIDISPEEIEEFIDTCEAYGKKRK